MEKEKTTTIDTKNIINENITFYDAADGVCNRLKDIINKRNRMITADQLKDIKERTY